jgi:hypothetical protein
MSLLNMVNEQLRAAPERTVISTHGMLAGTEQILTAFFSQVSGQLRLRRRKESGVADLPLDYGEALVPLGLIPVAVAWL